MELLSPKVDFIFKKIFGNEKKPNILISFLNAVLYNGKEEIVSVEINNTDIEKDYLDDKFSRLDIKATTNKKELINIEIQRANKQNMAERTLYYWSKMYSQKIIKGEDYYDLPRTVCINVLDYKMPELKKEASYHNIYELQNKVSNASLTSKLELHFIELPKFKLSDEENLLELWLEFIERPESSKIKKAQNQNHSIKDAQEQLEFISASDEERTRYLKREETLLEGYSALAGSYRVGIEEGRAEGHAEGEKQKSYEVAKNSLALLNDAQISAITGLSIDEISTLRTEQNIS